MKVLLDLDFGLNPKFQQWITNTCRMRTNRETSTWLRKITEERLSMRDSLEHAKVFFGGFSGDHKTFMSWNKDFLQQERKMKKEAQQRLMGDVGGTGKYNATPPSTYCPSAARFRFISENYLCEKCENRFENETEVMIHIRNVHDKDVRKMFASDIMGSWRRSDNLRFFGLFRFSETSGVASSFSQFSPFAITMKPALFLIVFPVGFFDNLLTKESSFCFPELFSSVTTS